MPAPPDIRSLPVTAIKIVIAVITVDDIVTGASVDVIVTAMTIGIVIARQRPDCVVTIIPDQGFRPSHWRWSL